MTPSQLQTTLTKKRSAHRSWPSPSVLVSVVVPPERVQPVNWPASSLARRQVAYAVCAQP